MDLGLQGKHVLITGASGGIGIVTARKYLEQGARVSLHYRSKVDTLQALVAEKPEWAERIEIVKAEASEEQSVLNSVKQSVTCFGAIHVLVANHGIFPPDDVAVKDMSLEQWNSTLNTNLTGTFLYIRSFLKQLEEAVAKGEVSPNDHPNIVMIGSTSGMFGEAGHSDYSSSKSAMMYGLCFTIKNEIVHIIPTGRCNVVAPGWVLTPMAEAAIKKQPDVVDRATQTIAMKKIAMPEEVADAVLFLSSRVASHTSGAIFPVTGGMEGRLLWGRP